MWFLLFALAHAAVPTSVRPVAAPDDAAAQFAEWAASRGRGGEALACRDVWANELVVCFTVVEDKVRRWVSDKDLAAWEVDLDGLVRTVVDRAKGPLGGRPRATAIGDMPGTYWLSAEGDGWDAALLLRPEWIVAKVGGGPVLVGAPSDGAVLAWRPGDAAVDKVLAVGVRRMFDASPAGVTAVVHKWDGERWEAFGEAVVAPQEP